MVRHRRAVCRSGRAALRIVCAIVALAIAGGCTSVSPSEHANAFARAHGFERMILAGAPFRHLAYFRRGAQSTDVLHVYVEHDGTPWTRVTEVAADPTPRNPLMLELMAQDAAPSLYLGRPCYFAIEQTTPCDATLWTARRYSPEVVGSMASALRLFVERHPAGRIAFFGYSGGGTLALLLAERFPETIAVITVAANLDTDAWAEHHRYTPLADSLNPALRPPLSDRIVQRHYAGTGDRNVPVDIVRRYAARHPNAAVVEIDGFDHVCCWQQAWPTILGDAERDSRRN